MSQSYKAKCHCGKVEVAFEAAPPAELKTFVCNCSICKRRQSLMAFPDKEKVTVVKGGDEVTHYSFGKKKYDHTFCPVCGVSPYGTDTTTGGYMINLNAVEGLDLDALSAPTKFDGAST